MFLSLFFFSFFPFYHTSLSAAAAAVCAQLLVTVIDLNGFLVSFLLNTLCSPISHSTPYILHSVLRPFRLRELFPLNFILNFIFSQRVVFVVALREYVAVPEGCGFGVGPSALNCALAFSFSSLGSYLPFSAAGHRYPYFLPTYLPAYLPHTHEAFLFLKGIPLSKPAQLTFDKKKKDPRFPHLSFPSREKRKGAYPENAPLENNNNNRRCPTRPPPSSTTVNPPLLRFRVIIPSAAVANGTRLLTTKFNISNHSSNSIRNPRIIIISSTSGHTRSNSLSEVHTRVIIRGSHRTGGI